MTILSVLFLVATIAYLAMLVLVVLRNPRSSLNWVCALILLALAAWSFEDIFHNNINLAPAQLRYFERFGTPGWTGFASLLLLFVLILTHQRRALRSWFVYPLLAAVPALFSYLQFTGHMVVGYARHSFGWVAVWSDSVGPIVYYFTYLLLVGFALAMLVRYRRQTVSSRERRQTQTLIITTAIPVVIGTVTDVILPRFTAVRLPEVAGIIGLVWAGGLYYSATQHGLMNFSPNAAADEILSTMVDALLLLSPDNRIVNVNRATRDLLGYRKSELVGHAAEMLFALPGQFRDEARQVLAGLEIRQQEITALARNGREIPMSISARIMRDSSGVPLGSVWVLRDMTVHRESEEETRRLADGLAALNRLAVDLAAAPADLDLYRFLAERLKSITGAIAVSTNEYLPATREMRIRHLVVESGLLARVNQILGRSILNLRMPVTPETYDRVVNATVGSAGDLTETTFGAIPRALGAVIQKTLGIDYFTGMAFAHHGELLGTAVISARAGYPIPHPDVLRTFANIASVALLRKRLEDALRDSENLYRSLVERANDGIVIIQDQVIRYANTRLRQMWGDAEARLEGTPFNDYVDSDEIPKIARRYQQRIAGEAVPATYETVLRRRDGSRLYVELNAGVITVQDKPADLVIIRDVTERRRAALALHDSEENFRALAERANDAIFISDADGRYVYANERAVQITGYAADELLHLGFRNIIRPQDVPRVGDWAAARLRGESAPSQYETAILRRDGREVEVESSVARTYWRGAPANLAVVRDITERKQAERALRAERDRAEEYLNIAGVVIVALDLNGDIALLNRMGSQLLGYAEGELIGRNWFRTCLPDRVRASSWAGFQSLAAGNAGPAQFFEGEILTRAGAELLIAWHSAPLRDDTGRVIGTLNSGTDITAQHRAEAARRESDQRYRVLFEHAPVGIYRTTPGGRILMANPALVRMLGYDSFEELAGRNLEAEGFEPGYDRQQFKTELEREGEIRGKESQWRRRDGSLRFVRENALAIRGREEQTLYYEGTVEDISDRKQAENELLALRDRLEEQVRTRTAELTFVNRHLQEEVEEHRRTEEQLRQSEARFRGVFEKAPTGMCLTGPDGRFLDVNQALCEMLGYTHDELAATGFAAVTCPDDLPVSRECVRTLLAGERETYHFEKRYLKKSGDALWTDVSTILLRTPEGAPLYFITHIFDLSGRRMREERIRALNRELEGTIVQLEATNKELESFSYSVSHDLRAPLRSLDGFSQALLDDFGDRLDQGGKDDLNRIRDASQRMGQLIDDLLKLSRVTRSELHLEPVDISRLAQDVVDELSRAEPDRKVAVIVAADVQARSDVRLLRILLANLLGNAWKFTARRPDAVIEFGVIRPGIKESRNQGIEGPSNPVFFVRDNGAGFDMVYVGKLFAPFQRLHGMAEFPGSGIGLATAQRIVLRHGGRIWAEATPGQGATFYFTLGGKNDE